MSFEKIGDRANGLLWATQKDLSELQQKLVELFHMRDNGVMLDTVSLRKIDDKLLACRKQLAEIWERVPSQFEPVNCEQASSKDHDPVNHPFHYTSGAIECIDALEACMTPEEFKGFLKGNSMKYLWRLGRKDKLAQDAAKSQWYLNRLNDYIKKANGL